MEELKEALQILMEAPTEIFGIYNEMFGEFSKPLLRGTFAAIVVFIVEIILMKKRIIFCRTEKKIEKARREGRVVTARLLKVYNHGGTYRDKGPYTGTYEYVLNGKKKEYRVLTKNKPRETRELFYGSNSNRVFVPRTSPFIFLIYIIPILVAGLVIYMNCLLL